MRGVARGNRGRTESPFYIESEKAELFMNEITFGEN